MAEPLPLPVGIDLAYADNIDDPSVKAHQQHHDTIHTELNAHLTGTDPHGDRAYVDALPLTKTYVYNGTTYVAAATKHFKGSVDPNTVTGVTLGAHDTWDKEL